jgi:hypothetical protein
VLDGRSGQMLRERRGSIHGSPGPEAWGHASTRLFLQLYRAKITSIKF